MVHAQVCVSMVPKTATSARGTTAPQLRDLVAAAGTQIHLKKGVFLFEKGSAPSLYLVLRGNLLLAGPSVNQIQFLPKSRVIGLPECMAQMPWTYAGFAATPLVVHRLAAKDLQVMLAKRPELRRHCLAGLLMKAPGFE